MHRDWGKLKRPTLTPSRHPLSSRLAAGHRRKFDKFVMMLDGHRGWLDAERFLAAKMISVVAASVAMASPPTTTSTDPLASLSHVAVSMGTLKRNGEEESSQRAKKKAKVDGSV